jgi:sucrose-6-phosphate hydrolase SacC (GH32 family)
MAPLLQLAQQPNRETRASLYQEALRPQFHFSARYWDDYTIEPGPHQEGWINDVNGLVYYNGQYHFFAQRWWSCWLHAVSRDLIHWEEMPPAFGKGGQFGGTQSGGAVVDYNNVSGLGNGQQPVMIAFWSSTDNLNQCISYSQDGGLNWMKYDQNPVLTHAHRDPAVFWHEPSRQWIMVLYGPTPGMENTGSYGFNGESNDAHDALQYTAGQWNCSVIRLDSTGQVIVTDLMSETERQIDASLQRVGSEAFYVGAKTGTTEFLNGDISEIRAYDRTLSATETRQLLNYLANKWNLKETPAAEPPAQGLVLRLDAAETPSDEDGRIARWPDLSGQGHDLSQPDDALRPRKVPPGQWPHPVIQFNGRQYLKGPAIWAEGDNTITLAAVWRRERLGGSEVVCEQNSASLRQGRRAALLAQGHSGSEENSFLLFASTNLLHWRKLDTSIPNMFECPDMFPLCIDGDPKRQKWIVVDGNGDYIIGNFDGSRFEPESPKLKANQGDNFYATRTFNGLPDNRRIQMAWMRGGQYPGMPFNQQITFPCELTLRSLPEGLRMCSYPVDEIRTLYKSQCSLNHLTVKPGNNALAGIAAGPLDIEIELNMADSTCQQLELSLLGNTIRYHLRTHQLDACDLKAELLPRSGQIHLRILVDRMSVEVFGNHGEVAITHVAPALATNPPLALHAIGGTASLPSVKGRHMDSIWPVVLPQ